MNIGLFASAPGWEGALQEQVERLVAAERDGFSSAWAWHVNKLDALTVLAVAGCQTQSVELGTAVISIHTRHPMALAQQALTTQAATGNRLSLGIGASHRPVVEKNLGMDFSNPVDQVREYIEILNGLLAGEIVDFKGSFYQMVMALSVANAAPPSLLLAALGPRMLRLAGRLTDGTITWMGGPKYLSERAVPTIVKAAEDSGRPSPRIVAGLPVAITHKVGAAEAAASEQFNGYAALPSYKAILDFEGASTTAAAYIFGNEESVDKMFQELRNGGVTDLMALPFEIPEDPSARGRTYSFLSDRAQTYAR